ncbi:MAG: hypothetical protein P8Y70_01060 [Candidatus Lokiarchaeota archaeon]
MYLFRDKKEIEILVTCKLCLNKIVFKITADEYKNIKKFPFKREDTHGDPKHKLTVFINKNLEINNFDIANIIEKEDDKQYTQDLTQEILGKLGLSDKEIELYFKTTGRDIVSIGEMALLINESKEECERIAKKFVDKGLFKEIVGVTPHYTALPPYAALINQLEDFYTYIGSIKKQLPSEVDKSFSQFKLEAKDAAKLKEADDLVSDIKQNMLSQLETQKHDVSDQLNIVDQIHGITSELENLDGITNEIFGKQINELTQQFEEINSKTAQIIKNQVDDLRGQMDNIKSTISQNLRKLRLGVIQQTVEQVIEKVVTARLREITQGINIQLSVNKMVFTDELKKATEKLNTEFISKLKDSIKNTVKELSSVPMQKVDQTEDLMANIDENFESAVELARDKIEDISGGIFQSLGNLKDLFSRKVVDTIDHTLEDIMQRLRKAEITTSEFWEQAKTKGAMITMKDVWFIRSPEAAEAHINDELSKAKMRVLIVAPQITDVDLETIKSCPRHVNIRIAANINMASDVHKQMINQLDTFDNVDYRNRTLQNIWGINRDYEEVILCVISKTIVKNEMRTEIAGIGSIIQEHIKIFVPILEEAWMNAQKEIVYSVESSSSIRPTPTVQEFKEKPVPIEPKESYKLEPEIQPAEISEKETVKTEVKKPKPKKPESKKPEVSGSPLREQFESLIRDVDNLPGIELAKKFEEFHDDYIDQKGYHSSIKNIQQASNLIKGKTEPFTEM